MVVVGALLSNNKVEVDKALVSERVNEAQHLARYEVLVCK